MMRTLKRALGPLLSLLLFGMALWVLDRELRQYHYHDVVGHLRSLPVPRVLLAVALTVLSYAILTGYDTLALRHVQNPLPYRRIALASFLSYAFSNNVGNTLLTGGSIRYRLYSGWGLSAVEITKIVLFCGLTFWVGFLTVAGTTLLASPSASAAALRLAPGAVRSLGASAVGLVGLYLLWAALRPKPFRLRGMDFALPTLPLAFGQAAVATADLSVAAAALYALLPPAAGLSYPVFLGAFVLAVLAGVVSQVPGGVGVFESSMVLLLRPYLPSSAVLGSLVAFRGIYYLAPLSVAAVLLGTQEFRKRKEDLRKLAGAFQYWAPALVPPVLAFATFAAGAILLLTGAAPPTRSGASWPHAFVPLPLLESSHFLSSVAGAALLVLARGIQRRVNAAYHLAVALLGAGAVLAVLRGIEWEGAIGMVVMLAALLPCRREFYRKASVLSQRFSAPWAAMVVIVMAATVWLGLFSFKHVNYAADLWWQFSVSGHAPRFMRATVGAAVVLLLFSAARLLRPAESKPALPDSEALQRVRSIVRQWPGAFSNLALLGDKSLLFAPTGNAFIMYAVEGRSWVALGDPVGPEEEWADLVWGFRELSDRYGGWTVFYEVGADRLHLYLDLGLTLLKLGEEGRVPLSSFSLEGGARKWQRQALNKLSREGWTFETAPPEEVAALLPTLKGVSDAWLESKNTREKGFSLGFFQEDYLKEFPVALVRKEDRIVAFANMWLGAQKEDLSFDLIRYTPEAPKGVMDFLFTNLMLWGKAEGYRWFNLGMAPLAGFESRPLAPLWSRMGALIFRHGEHFYNFQGLREFKDKFDPVWSPRYLACPGGLAFPSVLVNLASLISGGLTGVIGKGGSK